MKRAKAVRDCEPCGGTGWQWLNRSWLTADGYHRERCGICGGSGKSDYRYADARFIREQARRRIISKAGER